MGFGFECFQTSLLKVLFPPGNRRRRSAGQAAHFPHALALHEQATGYKTTNFQCLCTTFWSHNDAIIPGYPLP